MVFYHFEDYNQDFELNMGWDLWLSNVCGTEHKTLEEINLIFCSDGYLLKMNREHLEHDYFTDIITFDYCVDNQVFGDLFISCDRVRDNANKEGVDFLTELERVIVHGVLHLVGYSDSSESEKATIRSKEDFYLSLRPER